MFCWQIWKVKRTHFNQTERKKHRFFFFFCELKTKASNNLKALNETFVPKKNLMLHFDGVYSNMVQLLKLTEILERNISLNKKIKALIWKRCWERLEILKCFVGFIFLKSKNTTVQAKVLKYFFCVPSWIFGCSSSFQKQNPLSVSKVFCANPNFLRLQSLLCMLLCSPTLSCPSNLAKH